MQKKLFIVILTFILFSISALYSETADTVSDTTQTDTLNIYEDIKIDSVNFDADSIYYDFKSEDMTLSGNAQLVYQTSTLTADSININLKTDKSITHGNAKLKDGTQLMIGDDIKFDIEEQSGIVTKGATKFDKGFYYGDEIRKVGKEVFDVDNGYFTTCDDEEPHFYIYSKYMRMYRNDRIVMKPIVFYVNHFPVFAVPFGTFSLKRGRKSGFIMPSPGYNKGNGKFVEDLAFFAILSDNADVYLSTDYYEKRGWNFNTEGIYKKRYKYDGRFYTSYQNRTTSNSSESQNWYASWSHSQTIGLESKLSVNMNFTSSKTIWENSTDENERLKEVVSSTVSYNTKLFGNSLYTTMRYNDQLDEKRKDIVLPNISYSLRSRPFYELFLSSDQIDNIKDENYFWKGFRYSYSTRFRHEGDIYDSSADLDEVLYKSSTQDTIISEHYYGMNHKAGISYSNTLFDWLNYSQSFSYNESWYDKDKENNKYVRGYNWSTSSSANFSMYGVRTFNKTRLSAVRHVITPNISFSYKPDWTENSGKYYTLSGISVNSSRKSRSLSLGLSNLWQIKYWDKEREKEKSINDLLKITSSASYNLEAEGKGFTDFRHNVSVTSLQTSLKSYDVSLSGSGNCTQDAYDFEIYTWSVSSSFTLAGPAKYKSYFPRKKNKFQSNDFFNPNKKTNRDSLGTDTIDDIVNKKDSRKWKLTSSLTYTKNIRSHYKTASLSNRFNFKLTKNWDISYRNTIDLKEERLMSQTLIVTRALHCWDLTFTYNRSGDVWDYRIVLKNLKLPQSLKIQTHDSKYAN